MCKFTRDDFVTAYVWMFGSTKQQALDAYRKKMKAVDYKYVEEVVSCFRDNAKRSFYND